MILERMRSDLSDSWDEWPFGIPDRHAVRFEDADGTVIGHNDPGRLHERVAPNTPGPKTNDQSGEECLRAVVGRPGAPRAGMAILMEGFLGFTIHIAHAAT